MSGPKETEGKLDWSVFPFNEAQEVCKVFVEGARKYGAPFTYRQGIDVNKLFAAAIRHLVQMQIYGMDSCDNESGCFHAAHVAANALMILSQII
jgi:hypothetical protein